MRTRPALDYAVSARTPTGEWLCRLGRQWRTDADPLSRSPAWFRTRRAAERAIRALPVGAPYTLDQYVGGRYDREWRGVR